MGDWTIWLIALTWFIFGWNLRGLKQKFRDLRELRERLRDNG
jgi:hypothetical protein